LCGVRVNPPVEILRQSVHVLEPVLLRERERERERERKIYLLKRFIGSVSK